MDVVNFLFLPGIGCIYLRAEWFLWTGANTPLPADWPNEEHPACGDKCWVCRKSYMNDMIPIIYKGIIEFLDSEYFCGKDFMPYPITHEMRENLPNRLWESPDYRKKIFGIKNVAKYNVNSFFFQLLAAGILTFKWVDAQTGVVCTFGTDDNNKIKYKIPKNWKGFTFRKPGRGGGTIDFSDILNKT